ncbi:MAG: anhydro-N-acetylmuramic acid kinase [Vampirovibrionales bacterium]|nr:anhydro-N-acetylmuramic acid kinase [Vampirovibrionales bacterium]
MDDLNQALRQALPGIVVGLMSGTSADSVDACCIEITPLPDEGRLSVEVLADTALEMPEALLQTLMPLMEGKPASMANVCRLNKILGEWFASAAHAVIQKSGIRASEVLCIASHGQTVSHLPDAGCSLQLGEAAFIAEKTGVSVVSNFRLRDMAAGGQGAPLVPFADLLLFGQSLAYTRVVQNIGGIANVTVLPPLQGTVAPFAFDTGPGNMLIDGAMQRLFLAPFDKDGEIAAVGAVDAELLADLSDYHYYHTPPPKTCGRETFGAFYLDDMLARYPRVHKEHVLATMTRHTAKSIADAYARFVIPVLPADAPLKEALICGGGALNPTLMLDLQEELTPLGVRVASTDEFGIASKLKEAISFAVLGWATMNRIPGNIPSCTGARRAVLLGQITPA